MYIDGSRADSGSPIMTIRAIAQQRPLSCFFVLAFAIAWIAWTPLVLSRSGLGLLPIEGALWWIAPGSFAPSLAALTVRWMTHHDFRIAQIAPSPRHLFAGLLLGIGLIVLGFLVLPGAWLGAGPLSALSWGALAAYPYAVARALVMAGPIGEEPGWRGFALPLLQARYTRPTAALMLGVLWAAWHAPLFLVPQWSGSPAWVYLLLVVSLCFMINLGFNVSRASVIVPIVLHAVFNASSAVLGRLLQGVELDLSVRPDLVLACSFALIAAGIAAAWHRGRRGDHPRRPG